MKFILITDSSFEKRDYIRLGLETLAASGVNVEAWDLTPLLKPEKHQSSLETNSIYVFKGYRSFSTLRELAPALMATATSDTIINIVPWRPSTVPYHWLLRAAPASLGTIRLGTLPPPLIEKANATKSVDYGLRLLTAITRPAKIANYLFRHTSPLSCGARPYDFILAGGTAAASHPMRNKNTTIIEGHSIDYESHLNTLRESAELTPQSYAVFLDEYVPFHSDYKYINLPPPCTADEYYPLLRGFFQQLKNQWSLPVVIAAHPRSDATTNAKYYGEFQSFEAKTPQLVRNAALVIAHSSTALSFAALYKKPTLLLMHPSYRGRLEEQMLAGMAQALACDVFPLGTGALGPMPKLTTAQLEAYAQYLRLYVKSDSSPNSSVWSTFKKWATERPPA